MPDKKDKKRDAPISYRPPKALREAFHARVAKSGLSTNAFITHAIFAGDPPRQSRRPVIEKELLARLLGEAGHIRDALHEVQLGLGDNSQYALLLEAACDELAEIRMALIKAYGRRT